MNALDGIRVLVVDDDPDALAMMALLLNKHGAATHSARSAAEALRVIASTHPDILISDLAMPHEDGYALIRSVRALPPSDGGAIHAIAVSALGATEAGRALANGFERLVCKPFRIASLVAMLAALHV